jgi:hypothetical protein
MSKEEKYNKIIKKNWKYIDTIIKKKLKNKIMNIELIIKKKSNS